MKKDIRDFLERNCIQGFILVYAALIEYYDNDSDNFNFLLSRLKNENLQLEEFYAYRNEDQKETTIDAVTEILEPYI